ncbi:MAG: uridine kinase [Defluviitaleaceae bacterium]|nr:uridine kinase [Defluviitaleaceae bacterium]
MAVTENIPRDLQARLAPLLPLLTNASVLAIDGRCGSGKSTITAYLARQTGAGVVCMDDFFLPAELRTKERFATPGGNIHHERFAREVLPHIKNGTGFSYRIFDCNKMEYGGVRRVAPSRLYIIEGAYSHHPVLGDYMDVRVFSDVDPATQLERIKQRNEKRVAMFAEKWIPLEEAYINEYGIWERADVVV